MRIIHEHLPIPFSETYCRLAFIAIAWIQEIYFSRCSLKKGMSNEFLLGESKCQGGILLRKTCFTGRKNVKQESFFKRHINLHIGSSRTNNKHSFGVVYFQSALKCWHSRGEESSGIHIFHFPFKRWVIQEVSNLFKFFIVEEPAWPSSVEFLALGSDQVLHPRGRGKSFWQAQLKGRDREIR